MAAFDGAALADGQVVRLFADFFAYEPGLRNGVFPSVGDLNRDGRGDLVFGAGPGGGPRVLALDGAAACAGRQSELANFFAGDATSREGVEVSTSTAADGTTRIVGTDLATNATAVFGADGGSRGGRGGRRGGHGGPAGQGGSGYTADQAEALAAGVVGTYTGDGTGLLTTLSDTAVDLSGVSSAASVTVAISSATPVLPDDLPDDADLTTVRLRGFDVVGTVTVATDAGTLSLAVTGTLQLARGRSSDTTAARGVLRLSTDRAADADPVGLGTGLALTAALTADGLSVSRLLASDRSADPGYVFQSPASRTADRLVLAKAATA